MASPATTPGDVASARKQVETSNFFALCYLMLSNLAYTTGNSGQEAVQQITRLLPTMPVPQGTVQGRWNLAWGPQVSHDNSNLMYAAEFLDSVSGMVVFSSVVIRGTDTQAKPSGVLKQIIEDLDATVQVEFPTQNQAGSKIARGSHVGLDVLNKFTDSSNRTIEQYLKSFVERNPGAPIVVTGHSLGGCLTTVLALDLSAKLPAETKIVPNTFAAPTAGNHGFIQLYEQRFPFSPRWFNTFDLVPMAFAGLSDIKRLWKDCNRPAPGPFKIIIDGFGLLLGALHVSYNQESIGHSNALAGVCQPPSLQHKPSPLEEAAIAEIQALLEKALHKLHDDVKKLPVLGGILAELPFFKVYKAAFDDLAGWVQELLFQHSVLTGYWNAVASTPGVAQIRNPFIQAATA